MHRSHASWAPAALAIVAACGGGQSPAPGQAKSPEPVYSAVFRVGQTWDFPVEIVEETDTAAPHTTALQAAHCTVTTVHEYRAARLATVACDPSDPEPEIEPPFAGRFLATATGLWEWPPKDESEDADQEPFGLDELDPKQMLVPAALTQLRRVIPSGCLGSPPLRGGSAIDNMPPPDGSYSLLPWKDA